MKTVLLVARISQTRDGVQALLASISDVDVVTVTGNIGSALVHTSEICPDLIVLIIDHLTDDLNKSVATLRNRCLEIPMLVLTDSEAARQDLINSQIDAILRIGIQAAELSKVIETLLKTNEPSIGVQTTVHNRNTEK